MARIRTIKPEFFTSEDIVCMSTSARLLYIALWCEADREGRMQWKPRTFKMRYMPADDVDVSALCEEIADAGLVVLYGDGLAYIPTFSKHQHINPREANSALPDPHASARVTDASARVQSPSLTRREEGKERKEVNTRDVLNGFDQFWTTYPKKVGKAQAEKAWSKIIPDAGLLETILSSVRCAARSPDWTKDDGQFIPHPATWLNAKRWEDERTIPASVNSLFAGMDQ